MANDFLCPSCKGQLRVSNRIIVSAKASDRKGLLLLTPTLGDYRFDTHPSFELKENELLEVHCPICSASLTAAEVHKNLAKVLMVDEENKESEVIFCRVVGQHCTFRVEGESVEHFGEDFKQYVNFFGV
jgi:uncharacterized protein YbaR (Trm112 family)